MNLFTRLNRAWKAFANKDPTNYYVSDIGAGNYSNPTRHAFYGNSRTSASSLFNRIAIDVSMINFRHAKVDDNNQFLETIDSNLNKCLNFAANIDQPSKSFLIDVVVSMFDEGSIAIVPIDTTTDDLSADSDTILTLRCGRITQWYPMYVDIDIYNDSTGLHETVKVPKTYVAVIENPLYHIINDTASKLSKILGKMTALDSLDTNTLGSKLDLIVQLPYSLNYDDRKKRAENRKKEIVDQLVNSQYGIAYVDSTEKIVQLNRPIENDYMAQIKYYTEEMYHQLGWSDSVFNGSASESEMLNYYNRTISPICASIADAMSVKWLDEDALMNNQRIIYYRNPFDIAQVSDIAEISDKLTRNEILTPNEIRSIIGFKPASDPRADELRNRNISSSNDQLPNEITENSIEDIRTYNE